MIKTENQKKYYKYLKSSTWKRKKRAVHKDRGGKCERCGCSKDLQVHHKTYENIYNERIYDLELLCRNCHMKEHKIAKKKRKRSRRKYE